MAGLPFTLFDLLVLAIVGLSGLVGLASGATAAILGLASWIGAAAVALLYGARLTPFVVQAGAPAGFAELIAMGGLFIVALIAFRVVAGLIARAVSGSVLGPLDRLLGLAFGLARGAALVCVLYLVASQFIRPDLQPAWMNEAYLIGPVRQGAALIAGYLPEPVPVEPLRPPPAADRRQAMDAPSWMMPAGRVGDGLAAGRTSRRGTGLG